MTDNKLSFWERFAQIQAKPEITMYVLAENTEIRAESIWQLRILARKEYIYGMRKIDWDKVRDDKIVGQGGICLDNECNCYGSWTYWLS